MAPGLGSLNDPNPICEGQDFQADDRGEKQAVLQRESHQLRLFPNGNAGGSGRDGNRLKADHFSQYAAR